MYRTELLKNFDPEIFGVLKDELYRQKNHLELIASENYVSEPVLIALGSVLTNKYAEGYPGKRYYGGCVNVDTAESLAIERAKEIFGADHANVQPHSGCQANQAVYKAVLKPGDKMLALDLNMGGHLSHGFKLTLTGSLYDCNFYGVNKETEMIDMDEVRRIAEEIKPKLILTGASAYSRFIDFEAFAKIAEDVGAYFMVDMAHIAGLIAGGVHPSPVPHAHFVTTTTHKTLRGPRGGMVLCKKDVTSVVTGKTLDMAKKINSAVFPGLQGGPLEHVIAAKAVCFKEALTDDFKDYVTRVVANSKKLCQELIERGFRIVSGGTDNHCFLVDLTAKNVNGQEAETALDKVGITVNKNLIPYDPLPPLKASGIRIGTPTVTTLGLGEGDMTAVAEFIDEAIKNREDDTKLAQINEQVVKLCQNKRRSDLYEDYYG